MAFGAWQRRVAVLSAVAAMGLSAHPAAAHPHVFPVVTITVQFDAAGRFSGVHEKWSFDYDYSGVVKSTIDKDGDGTASPEELTAALGMDGVLTWLPIGDYMTRLTLAGRPVPRGDVKDMEVKFFAGKLLFEFTVPLKDPQPATLGAGVDVFDPEFYYDIEFDYPDVAATGTPATCQVARREKDNLDPVAIMIIRKLGLTADPKVLSDPASGYAVRVAVDCK